MKLTKEQKRAKWLKEPIAIIEKPLRLIGKTEGFGSDEYANARHFAVVGKGHLVQKIAREVFAK